MKKKYVLRKKPFWCEACGRATEEFNCERCGDRTTANI